MTILNSVGIHPSRIASRYSVCVGPVDRKFLRRFVYSIMVLDECHMLKNMGSQRYAQLMTFEVCLRSSVTSVDAVALAHFDCEIEPTKALRSRGVCAVLDSSLCNIIPFFFCRRNTGCC